MIIELWSHILKCWTLKQLHLQIAGGLHYFNDFLDSGQVRFAWGAFIIWKGGKSLNACILGVNKDYENGRNLQKEGGISTPVMY